MIKRNTDDMNTELMNATDLQKFLEENTDHFSKKDFSRLLKEQIRKKGVNKADLAKASGMSDVYLHQLISGRRSPSRTRLLCICIGLKLTLDETQRLLLHAGMGQLYARNRWDAIIIYGIDHQMDLYTINDLLFDANEDTMI
ncbi:MAG: helix-turn-helix domain-containing protein [Lachnospiraceae bacterium]|nr:helix-turn-helix domain-containing protein [Lachnospiraceae bacterium]